jgi:hypothetical protein
MNENVQDPLRQPRLYWKEMTDLKADASYIRLYRNSQGRWVTRLAVLKAIASSTGIAAWVFWKEYAFLWGAIIATSQVADALKDVFPFAKRHKAASVHSMILDNLFNDVQLEWEKILSGRYSDEEIMDLRHKLGKKQLDVLQRSFPEGLAPNDVLLADAKRDTEEYFRTTYGVN